MALKLDAKIPAGALEEKWSNHKAAIKVVSPANKRKLDIIIVGTGLGGASAAASLGELGYNVKVFCIQDSPRRAHSIAAQGGINAAKNYQNDNDSVYRLFYDTIKGGDYRAREANVYRLAEVSNLIIDQCVGQGVPFAREYGGLLANRSFGGAQVSRTFYARGQTGQQLLLGAYAALNKEIAAGSVKSYPRHEMLDIVIEDGEAKGIIARNLVTGEIERHGAHAVVIATGGFGANIKFRQEVNTGVWKSVKLDNSIGCTNIQKAAQGDGLIIAKKHGADLINLDDIQIHPCGTPGTGLMENIRTSGRNRIFVNIEGDRFVNEGAARDVLAGAIFAQPKSTYYVVVNKVRYPSRDWVDANGATIRDMVALGSVVEANTLEELAKKTGMNPAKLKASVDNYNKIVKGEMKDPLGFQANNKADTTLTEGPWYACKKVPTVHHTMGGIKINVNAQVIDVNGKVIPGLYAAGEVTGGIHGSNRLGGNAIADIMTFGRAAGTNVVKMK